VWEPQRERGGQVTNTMDAVVVSGLPTITPGFFFFLNEWLDYRLYDEDFLATIDPDALNRRGGLPMYMFLDSGWFPRHMVGHLIPKKNINLVTDNLWTPLSVAVRNYQDTTLIQALLAAGATPTEELRSLVPGLFDKPMPYTPTPRTVSMQYCTVGDGKRNQEIEIDLSSPGDGKRMDAFAAVLGQHFRGTRFEHTMMNSNVYRKWHLYSSHELQPPVRDNWQPRQSYILAFHAIRKAKDNVIIAHQMVVNLIQSLFHSYRRLKSTWIHSVDMVIMTFANELDNMLIMMALEELMQAEHETLTHVDGMWKMRKFGLLSKEMIRIELCIAKGYKFVGYDGDYLYFTSSSSS